MSETSSKNSGKNLIRQAAGRIGFRSSLSARLVGLLLLASAPTAALVIYNAVETREVAVREATIRLNTVARRAAENLAIHIRGAKHLLSALAEVPSVRRAEQPACGRLLGGFAQRAPRDTELNFTVAAHDGSVVCSWTTLTGPVNLANRDYFKEVLATRNASVGRPVISRISNTARLPVAYPILNQAGEVERLVTASISLERVVADLTNSPELAGAVFTIRDERGTVLFRHPDNEKWIGSVDTTTGIVKAESKGMDAIEATGLDGVRRVYALAHLDDFPQLGLTISAGFDKETLAAQADRALRNSLVLLALILAAALAGAWLLGEIAIRHPVDALAQAASQIAGGKLETRVGVAYGGGELGLLARAFDEMAVALQRQIEDIRRGEQKIRDLNTTLEQRVTERTEQFEAANKELESFSYSVSHDLRSPLRAIDGYSQMLEEDYAGKLDDEGRRLIGVIRDSSQKMGTLIDDLLAFSRLGRQPIAATDVDMNALADEVVRDLKTADGRSKFPDIKVADLPSVQGDRALLKQAWQNLLSNAIKYAGKNDKAVIEVWGNNDSGENVYNVKDNGAGFDMQYYNKLFGVFQRLHSNDEFPGTGVGLAIVQRVVARHGGRVWAVGKINEGAQFSFALPGRLQNG